MARQALKRKTYDSDHIEVFSQPVHVHNPDYIHTPPGEKIILKGVTTNNLKGIDIDLPKNQIITVTGVSGSGKSSFAFDTLYKEGQFRYIESLSSYLRQFFNLGAKPEIEYSSGLSPAVAIEQNKRVGNVRSSVGTLTEIDDYLRLLYAKVWDAYCYSCGEPIRAQSVEGIMKQIYDQHRDEKIYILQEIGNYDNLKEFQKFIKRNRARMDRSEWYTRYLTLLEDNSIVEYFYLESPAIPDKFFPIKVYGIFDRITVSDENHDRMREDIVKLLNEWTKFGIYQTLEWADVDDWASMKIGKDVYDSSQTIAWYTDKIFCPHCNITYPEFTTQHFSPNRIEWACPTCHGIGETLDVDLTAVIDTASPYMEAIIPWKDSSLGQQILAKLAQKYGINDKSRWSDLPEYFIQLVIDGDGEQLRISQWGKYMTITYRGLNDILTSQYNKWVLGVDFQSMFNLKPCEACHGDRLRPESLNVFLELTSPSTVIARNEVTSDAATERSAFGTIQWITLNFYDQTTRQSIINWSKKIETRALNPHESERYFGDTTIWDVITFENKETNESIAVKIINIYKRWSLDSLWAEDKIFLKSINKNFTTRKKLTEEYNYSEDYLDRIEQYGLIGWEFEIMDRHVVPPRDDDNNVQRYNLAQLQKLPIRDLVQFLETYKETTTKPIQLIDRILWPLLERSQTIQNLWLAYINLARSMDTLSWWEIQRLRLAKQLGNKLTGIMYVLDEPTIGLDDDEIQRVITAIRSLKDMGNTIVVVEHNEEFIQSSDWVVEIGPGAGDFGWELVFSGPYPDFVKTDTLTAQYVTGRKEVKIKFDHLPSPYRLAIHGAHEHNLKHIDTAVRLGSFTIITGPSGAGKTTLMYHTLYKFLEDRQKYVQWYIRLAMMQKGIAWKDILTSTAIRKEEYAEMEEKAMDKFMEEIKVTDITGYDTVSNVIYVDQSSIGKTPRSCPATFIGVFDNIRKMFAGTQDAKILWFTDSYFSFNSDKGACPECDGYGIKKVELQFLPDTYVPCTLCKGKRYKSEILTVRWHGKTINEILEMYVHEAHDFFSEIGFIEEELKIMVDIGLWYIKLGQAAHTLSWWESQRLKLVKHLLKQYKGHSIYFLDEPTVGLHPEDIQKLLYVLKHFLDRGDTILMIEHDKSLLQFADDVIRLKDGAVVNGK
jgi:excinuclease UvrABC ATPase subunit